MKKLLSIVLTLVMLLSFGVVSVAAEDAAPATALVVSVGAANVDGTTVTVPVVATGSLQALTVTMDYDDTLELVSATKPEIAGEDDGSVDGVIEDSAVFGPTTADPFKMQWAFAVSKADVVLDNTTIAVLTFEVVDTTAEEANINIEVTEAWDVDGNEVAATATGGTVDLKECAHETNVTDNVNFVEFTAEGIVHYELCTKCDEKVVTTIDTSAEAVTVAGKALNQQAYSAINVDAAGTYTIDITGIATAKYAYVKGDKIIANGYHTSLTDADPSNGENAFAVAANGTDITVSEAGIYMAFTPANNDKLPTANIGMSQTFNLGSSIKINFRVNKTNLGDFESVYAIINHKDYTGNVANEVVDQIFENPATNGTNYQFDYPVSAMQMGDDVTATYYGVLDGVDYTLRQKVDYSLVAYAATTNNVGYQGSDTGLKTLLSTMFEYGAIAQKVFLYRTDTLVTNNPLISEYIAANPAAETVDKSEITYTAGQTIHADSNSKKFGVLKGLNCESTVEVYYRMNVKNFKNLIGEEYLNDITFRVYWKEGSKTVENGEYLYEDFTINEAYDHRTSGAEDYYFFKADKITAAMMPSQTYIEAIYNDEVLVTSDYSINQYLYENYDKTSLVKTGGLATLGDICKAIATYGVVARDYFGYITL